MIRTDIELVARALIRSMETLPTELSDLDHAICQSPTGQAIVTRVRELLEGAGHVFEN